MFRINIKLNTNKPNKKGPIKSRPTNSQHRKGVRNASCMSPHIRASWSILVVHTISNSLQIHATNPKTIIALLSYIRMTPCYAPDTFHLSYFRTQSTSFTYWLERSVNVPTYTILLRRRSLLSFTMGQHKPPQEQPRFLENHHLIFLIFTRHIKVYTPHLILI